MDAGLRSPVLFKVPWSGRSELNFGVNWWGMFDTTMRRQEVLLLL